MLAITLMRLGIKNMETETTKEGKWESASKEERLEGLEALGLRAEFEYLSSDSKGARHYSATLTPKRGKRFLIQNLKE